MTQFPQLVGWLAEAARRGAVLPEPDVLVAHGHGALAAIVWATDLRDASVGLIGRPAEPVLHALRHWSAELGRGPVELGPLMLARCAAACELPDDAIAWLLGARPTGVGWLGGEAVAVLAHALRSSAVEDVVALLASVVDAPEQQTALRAAIATLAVAVPVRVPAARTATMWASAVAMRARPTDVPDPIAARLVDGVQTRRGLDVTVLWDASERAGYAGWLRGDPGALDDRASSAWFVVSDGDARPMALGRLAPSWLGTAVVELVDQAGDLPEEWLQSEVAHHVTSRLRAAGHAVAWGTDRPPAEQPFVTARDGFPYEL